MTLAFSFFLYTMIMQQKGEPLLLNEKLLRITQLADRLPTYVILFIELQICNGNDFLYDLPQWYDVCVFQCLRWDLGISKTHTTKPFWMPDGIWLRLMNIQLPWTLPICSWILRSRLSELGFLIIEMPIVREKFFVLNVIIKNMVVYCLEVVAFLY